MHKPQQVNEDEEAALVKFLSVSLNTPVIIGLSWCSNYTWRGYKCKVTCGFTVALPILLKTKQKKNDILAVVVCKVTIQADVTDSIAQEVFLNKV